MESNAILNKIAPIQGRSNSCGNDTLLFKNRRIDIECLRIIGCLLVIFNHTNERGFFKYQNWQSGSYFFDTFMSISCKAGVPIFLMISGAMLLSKNETIQNTLKRIPKIAIDLFLFTFFYYWIDSRLSNTPFSITETIHAIITSQYWHLWYLNAYIAFILSLPLLRKIAQALDRDSAIYFCILVFVFLNVIPMFEYQLPSWTINGSLKPTWILADVVYLPLIGYIIDKVLVINRCKWKHVLFLWILNIASIVFCIIMEYRLLVQALDIGDERYIRPFWYLNAAVWLITLKKVFNTVTISDKLKKILSLMGSTTFGTYLIHIIFLWKIPVLLNIWIQFEQLNSVTRHIGVYFTCFFVFIISGIVIWLLKKVPLIKKLL